MASWPRAAGAELRYLDRFRRVRRAGSLPHSIPEPSCARLTSSWVAVRARLETWLARSPRSAEMTLRRARAAGGAVSLIDGAQAASPSCPVRRPRRSSDFYAWTVAQGARARPPWGVPARAPARAARGDEPFFDRLRTHDLGSGRPVPPVTTATSCHRTSFRGKHARLSPEIVGLGAAVDYLDAPRELQARARARERERFTAYMLHAACPRSPGLAVFGPRTPRAAEARLRRFVSRIDVHPPATPSAELAPPRRRVPSPAPAHPLAPQP